jgi:lipid II:glycine glycyltransferase (peptidoglycan interpeptide bridge formation enzyme)
VTAALAAAAEGGASQMAPDVTSPGTDSATGTPGSIDVADVPAADAAAPEAAITAEAAPTAAAAATSDAARLRTDRAAWDAFVAAAPNGSFPQLSAWADANAARGWRSARLVVDAPAGPVGAQLLIHAMRPGAFKRGYAARGPVAQQLDRPGLEAFTDALQRSARRARLSHVVIDPEIERGPFEGWLADAGWRRVPDIQITRTRIVDLRATEEQLWGGLRSSARWSVNRARRDGYVAEIAGAAGLDEFERLYRETATRVGFDPNAAFREVFAAFDQRASARLLLCRDATGVAVSTLLLLDCGSRVIERYGASSLQGSSSRANYLIKWEAIRSSRELGMAGYDMWGTDQEGLATFKASFGGFERTYVGAWELVTLRPVYLAMNGLQRVKHLGKLPLTPGTVAATNAAIAAASRSPQADDAAAQAGPIVAAIAREAPEGWDEHTVAAIGGHVMQGTAWAAHRRAQGAEPWFVTFTDGHCALVLVRRQRFVPGMLATVRRGPAAAGDSPEQLAVRIGALAQHLRQGGARELFVDPELDASPAYEAAMDAAGFRVTAEVQPSIHVMRLPLPRGTTEESAWSRIAKTTRQRIRAAEAAGTTVRHDEDGSMLPAFGRLLVSRADVLGITIAPELGYIAAWRRFIAAGHARLLVAEHDGAMVGGLLLYRQGGMHATAYSADDASTRRALPGTMHLVRWTAIREALADGATAIELGGVDLPGHREPPGVDEPNHGLYAHKASFGAEWVVRTPARAIELRPWAVRVAASQARLLATTRAARRRMRRS